MRVAVWLAASVVALGPFASPRRGAAADLPTFNATGLPGVAVDPLPSFSWLWHFAEGGLCGSGRRAGGIFGGGGMWGAGRRGWRCRRGWLGRSRDRYWSCLAGTGADAGDGVTPDQHCARVFAAAGGDSGTAGCCCAGSGANGGAVVERYGDLGCGG